MPKHEVIIVLYIQEVVNCKLALWDLQENGENRKMGKKQKIHKTVVSTEG